MESFLCLELTGSRAYFCRSNLQMLHLEEWLK